MSIYDVFGGGKTFDKEKWIEKKKMQKKEAYEKVEAVCAEMVQGGEAFQKYLDIQGRFDRYSVFNAALVSAVKPDAVQLKEYKEWRRQGVYVNKDAQMIVILEPGETYTRKDGSEAISYNPKEMYDVSDTSMKEMPEAKKYEMKELISALYDASPVKCQVKKDLNMGAYYDTKEKVIFVRDGLKADQLFASMAKEVAAAILEDQYPGAQDKAFKAYCVSYMLSKRYGISTQDHNFSRLPERYASLSPMDLRADLGTIRNTMQMVQQQMYKALEKKAPSKKKEYSR